MKFKHLLFNSIFIFFIFVLPISYYIANPIVEANGGSFDLDIGEKRNKAKLNIDSIDKIGSDLETYLNDVVPYRNYIIAADRKVNGFINKPIGKSIEDVSSDKDLEIDPYVDYYPFLTSDNGTVILGQSDWLYLNDSTILDIYKKENVFVDSYLLQINDELKDISSLAEKKGVEVVFVIAPEKQEVYEEYMPTIEVQNNDYNLSETIVKSAKDVGIDIIYPRDLLKSYKDKYRMYKKYDSHWNKISAYLTVNEIYKKLNLSMPTLNKLNISKTEEAGWDIKECSPRCRDLVLLANKNTEDCHYAFEYELDYEGIDNKYKDKTVCLIGDSFCVDMQSVIIKDFPNYLFVHGADELPMGKGLDNISKADIIIYELVERNIVKNFLVNLQNIKEALKEDF